MLNLEGKKHEKAQENTTLPTYFFEFLSWNSFSLKISKQNKKTLD